MTKTARKWVTPRTRSTERFKAAAYETVMNNGIPAQQEMTLPPGAYNLRLGVMDRPSQQIGTVDVPLVVTAGEATAKK